MSIIAYIIKAKCNIHGDIIPVDYNTCPNYIETGIKNICWSENSFCEVGVVGQNIIKELGDMRFLFECKFGYNAGGK